MANANDSSSPKLSRRQMVERLLSGMAAGAVWPLLPSAHPIHEHLKSGAILDRAAGLSEASDWTPLFLNAQQNAALIPLAECLLPGSTAAQVNRFIDLLLSVETADNQKKFTVSLAAFETTANERFARGLAALSPAECEVLLTALSAANAPQFEHFSNLKEWISGAYYSSEPGMRELGWTADRVFAAYPECTASGGSL
jgi:hypothetical protein